MQRIFTGLLLTALLAVTCFADWKLSQKSGTKGMPGGMIKTIYVKDVRQRHEMKTEIDPETAKMMEEAKAAGVNMPNMGNELPTFITMCDQNQNLYLNDTGKTFFIDYLDPSAIPPDKLARRQQKVKIVRKGTMTIDAYFEDSSKRQKMFGLEAKYGKFTQEVISSPDSCMQVGNMKMVMEGWFVNLTVENSKTCPMPIQPMEGGCMPKLIVKRVASPGFLLEGTTTNYTNGKPELTMTVETLELSKATLEQSLFELPQDYYEVDSIGDLMTARVGVDAVGNTILYKDGTMTDQKRRIAIDYFSGSASKLDQDLLRKHIAEKVKSGGFEGRVIGSAADLTSVTFANVIGVEVKKIKESGAAKVGGLFGKVTGNDSLAKAGKSEAEVIITLYAGDGKTVVQSAKATGEVSGSSNDAVKAAIDKVIDGLIAKIK